MTALLAPRSGLVLTNAQFEAMMRKGAFTTIGRVELRRGSITPMSTVYFLHAAALFELTQALLASLKQGGLRLKVLNCVALGLGEGFQPVADLVVYDPAWAPPDLEGPLPKEAVRLVVEVAGASLGDELGDKAREYARAGVAEYWVLDAKGQVVTQYALPSSRGYAEHKAVPLSRPLVSSTLPVTLDLAALAG